MSKIMPFRCNIMQVLINNPEGLTPAEIYEKVDDVYKSEKQCSPKMIDGHLMSMKGVEIVEARDSFIDENGELVVKYAFTDYGLETAQRWFPSLLEKETKC